MTIMQDCIEKGPEFSFVDGMPSKKKETPREKLLERIDELASEGVTKVQIAARISEIMPFRTIENWVQRRNCPPDWVCVLVLEKLK